jgi:hypothetical protein
MRTRRNIRGFTRLDALVAGVVCLILVLLVSTLHAMTQEHYFRTVCAAHLAEVGKTMFVYANDNETALPRAGGPTTTWGRIANWAATNRTMAYGLSADGNGGKATISSCFYLLVKYYQLPAGLFVCPGDEGTTEFSLAKTAGVSGVPANLELEDAWDFGPLAISWKSCSFAYHNPFGPYALTTARDPNLAVAADRNPWFKSPAGDPQAFNLFKPDLPGYTGGTAETAEAANAVAHQSRGQNVLFLDGRVTFETRAFCGLDRDNIYTISFLSDQGSAFGLVPLIISAAPGNMRDSVLLHDPDTFGGTAGR